MKKELKDYLHLYLECECMAGQQKGVLTEIRPTFVEHECVLSYTIDDEESGFYGEDTEEDYTYTDIKPILRPLSDMTEDEKQEYDRLSGVVYYLSNKFHDQVATDAHITQWLLSKRFDLFRLIDEGLALDATLLKVKEGDATMTSKD